MSQEQTRLLLLEHYRTHPKARVQDLLKLLYQSVFGCGHMLGDKTEGLTTLDAELQALAPSIHATNCLTDVGGGFSRLHLRAVQEHDLSPHTLYRLFELSALQPSGNMEEFLQKVYVLQELCRAGNLPFSAHEVEEFVRDWQNSGARPFSHSPDFKKAYHPAYRVVKTALCQFLPLFSAIDRHINTNDLTVLAIDGRCASGKTTLADLIFKLYCCAVVPIDHFFLQPHQRSAERLATPGGNIDHERFLQEVLLPIHRGDNCAYRPYDCSTGRLCSSIRLPEKPRLVVVEGSYSLHPALRRHYDLQACLWVGHGEQLRRLSERESPHMLKRFVEEWIPLEEQYFSAFDVTNTEFLFHTDLP